MSDSDTTETEQLFVRVPAPMVAAIDKLVNDGEYQNRSEFLRSGIRREMRDAGVKRGLPEHIGRLNDLGDGPEWHRCQECGATGDRPEHIDHHHQCPVGVDL